MRIACFIATTAIALLGAADAQRPQRPIKLFNGEDLSGWEGDPARWTVADGIITGSAGAAGPAQGAFLIYRAGLVDDFELKLQVRVSDGTRAGIIYRGQVLDSPETDLAGYRLAIQQQPGRIGMLYELGRRGPLVQRGTSARLDPGGQKRVLGPVDTSTAIDATRWNEYSITARGNRLIHKINGVVTCSAVDNDIEQRSLRGVLALQLLTSDRAARIEVKDIVLRRYNRSQASAPPERTAKLADRPVLVPMWIWTKEDPQPGEAAYFRRPWRQEKAVDLAELSIASDDAFTAYLNGEEIAHSDSGGQAMKIDVTAKIRSSYNHLAVRATDAGGEAGVAAHLSIEHEDGSSFELVSDRLWTAQIAVEEPPGWKTMPASRRNWQPCRVIGQMGIEPWGNLFENLAADTAEPGSPPVGTPPGFRIDQIYSVPLESQGSWTALAAGDDDRLFASDQNGSLYQITLAGQAAAPRVEEIDLPIGRANGLLWAFNSLYVCVNGEESGLYRLTDESGDGRLDQVTTLRRFEGSGEQGPHGIARGPSPQSLYIACGGETKLPTRFGVQRPPALWGEDQLLPRLSPGQATDENPVHGGWICMTRARGKEWELHSIGLRNPYDLAFNHRGDLFTSDGDSPSDLGAPFFRPVSIYHVPKGADFGARGAGRNFPPAYPDSLPPVAVLDPGSPTGLTFGTGAAFPARFQEALFVCDWSRSSIDAIHLQADGATYRGEREAFISAPDLRVTDIAIATDGAMYITTGGRGQASGLWRISYTGDEDSSPIAQQPIAPNLARKHALLERLGKLQDVGSPQVVATAAPHLSDSDRFIRHAARTAIEHHAPERWLDLFRGGDDVDAIIELSTALARAGEPEHQPEVVAKLSTLEFDQLGTLQKIGFLRAHGLAFIRLAPPSDVQRANLIAELAGHFPSNESALDLELCRMLIYLQAPESIGLSLELLTGAKTLESAAAYASFLSAAKDDWTPREKENYLAWFDSAADQPYGSRTRRFLNQIKSEFLGEKAEELHE